MGEMKYSFSKGMASLAMAAVVAGAAVNPAAVFAADVDVPTDGSSASHSVEANFTVTEDDLEDMGYGPKVCVPVSIGMTYSSTNKAYSGSGSVYAYGVIGNGKCISVTIDDTSAQYGKVYTAGLADRTKSAGSGYSASMSKNSWSQAECQTNLEDKESGGEITAKSTLSVAVTKDTFLPNGTGAYKTMIPLTVRMVDA